MKTRERQLRVATKGRHTANKPASADPIRSQRSNGPWASVVLALAVLFCAGSVYLVNRPDSSPAVSRKSPARVAAPPQQQLEKQVEELKGRVRLDPTDGKAWYALGRSYQLLRQLGPAAEAYGNAAALMPNDPNVLVDYADTLAAADGGGPGGRPAELVQKALQLEPNHQKGLAFAGTAAFNAGNYPLAISYFQRLQRTFPPDSDNARSVASTIAKARAAVAHRSAVVPTSATK